MRHTRRAVTSAVIGTAQSGTHGHCLGKPPLCSDLHSSSSLVAAAAGRTTAGGHLFHTTATLYAPRTTADAHPHQHQPQHRRRTSGFAKTNTQYAGNSGEPASEKDWKAFLSQLRRLRQQTRHALMSRQQHSQPHQEQQQQQQTRFGSDGRRADENGERVVMLSAVPTSASEAVDKRLMDLLGVSDLDKLRTATTSSSLSSSSAPTTKATAVAASPTDALGDDKDRFDSAIPVPEMIVAQQQLAAYVDVACRTGLRTHASAVLVVHHVLDAILDGSVLPPPGRGETKTAPSSPQPPRQPSPRDRARSVCDKWSAVAATLSPSAHALFFPESLCTLLLEHQARWMQRRVAVWQRAATAASVISTPSSTARQTLTGFLTREEAKQNDRARGRIGSGDDFAKVDVAIAHNALETQDLLAFLSLSAAIEAPTVSNLALTQAALRTCYEARSPLIAQSITASFMRALDEHAGPVDADAALTVVELAMQATAPLSSFEVNYGLWLRYAQYCSRSLNASPDGDESDAAAGGGGDLTQQHVLAFLRLLPTLAASVRQSAAQLEVIQRPFERLLTESDISYEGHHAELVRSALVALVRALARVSLERSARVDALTSLHRLALTNSAPAVTQHAEVEAACACVLAAAQQPSAALTVFNKLLAEDTRAAVAFQESLIGAVTLCGRSAVDEDVPRLLSFQALKYPLTEDIRDALAVKLLMEKETLCVRHTTLQKALDEIDRDAAADVGESDAPTEAMDADGTQTNAKDEARQEKREVLRHALTACTSQLASATSSLYLLLSSAQEDEAAHGMRPSLPVGHPSTISQAVVHAERRLFLFFLTLFQDLLVQVDATCEAVMRARKDDATVNAFVWSPLADVPAVRDRLAPALPTLDSETASCITREVARFRGERDGPVSISGATADVIQSLHTALKSHVSQLTGYTWPQTTASLQEALMGLSCGVADASPTWPTSSLASLFLPGSSTMPVLSTRRPLVFADLVMTWSKADLERFLSVVTDALTDGRGPYQLRHSDAMTLHRLHTYLATYDHQPQMSPLTTEANAGTTVSPQNSGRSSSSSSIPPFPTVHVMRATDELASTRDAPAAVFLEDIVPQAFPSVDAPALPAPVQALRHTLSSTSSSVRELFLPAPAPDETGLGRHRRVDDRAALQETLAHLVTFWLDAWQVAQIAAHPTTTLPFLAAPTAITDTTASAPPLSPRMASFFESSVPALLTQHDAALRQAQTLSAEVPNSRRGTDSADDLLRLSNALGFAGKDGALTRDEASDGDGTDGEDDMAGQNDWAHAQFAREEGDLGPVDDSHAENASQAANLKRRQGDTHARRRVKHQAQYVSVERFVDVLVPSS